MRYIYFTTILFINIIKIFGQESISKNLVGIWKSMPQQDLLYHFYDQKGNFYKVYERENGSIGFFAKVYGFHENCDPKDLNDLKPEGTGKYFFMVDDYVLKGDNKEIISQRLDCWSITIDHDNRITGDYEPNNLYLHFGRRAILDYIKVHKLPEKLENHLEQEQPAVFQEYQKMLEAQN